MKKNAMERWALWRDCVLGVGCFIWVLFLLRLGCGRRRWSVRLCSWRRSRVGWRRAWGYMLKIWGMVMTSDFGSVPEWLKYFTRAYVTCAVAGCVVSFSETGAKFLSKICVVILFYSLSERKVTKFFWYLQELWGGKWWLGYDFLIWEGWLVLCFGYKMGRGCKKVGKCLVEWECFCTFAVEMEVYRFR